MKEFRVMKFENIYHVEEIKVDGSSELVNLLLQHGWKILNIVSDSQWDRYEGNATTSYIIIGASKDVFESYSFKDAKEEGGTSYGDISF